MVESTKLIMKRYSLILFVLLLTTVALSACSKGPLPPADKTPPSVIFVSPANGAQNIPVNSSVQITFSEAMDASSINGQTIIVSTGNSNVQGSVTYSGVTAIFKPTSNLNPKTIYTVAVDAGVKDLAGNAMGSPYGYIFITGADLDTTPPRVVDVQPSNRKTGVSRNTVIVVMFSEPMDQSTITNTNVTISTVAGNIPSTVTPFGSAAIIKTTFDLPANTDFTILVTTRVKDLAGNAMTDAFLSNFRTGAVNDTSAPSVVTGSIIPVSGGTTVSVNTPISVTFSKPMNVSTINLSSFVVSDPTSTTIPGDIQYYGTTVVFTPSTSLLSSTAYTVTIKNSVMDLSGNTMSSDYFWSFTTEPQTPDSTPPQILSTYPTLNQTNVPVYRNVVVLFNETMLVSSITPTTFSLADSQGTIVPGHISSIGALVVFTPVQPLAYKTIYTATMTTTATDIAGNSLTSSYSWSFTTEDVASFTITPSAGQNGSISPSTAQIVSYGAGTTFTITPATGYQISDVLVDGSSVGAVASYSFIGVTADHSISASFTIKTYSIATSVSSGAGTISPANPTLNYGANQTFTITPNIGYHITGVLVDSVSVGALTSYTFTNVTNNHTISAIFSINTCTVTPSLTGGNGTISPTGPQTVNYNGTTTFTLSPSTGYHAVMSGTCGGTLSGNGLSYTTNAVTADCTVIASFSINTYTVTPSVSGVNGVISPTLPQTVNYNGTTTFTLSPDTGYHAVMSGTCGGTLSGNGLSYTTFGITADCTVIATFTIKATPIITWANPGAITFGTALGAAQLNATASLPGTFVYNPAAGAVLNAGANQTLSVTFTPTDTTNYSTASASVQITVNKATATVTLGSLSQTYDGTQQPATATTNPAGLTVTFTYNLSATPPTNVGSYSVVGTINDINYQGSASGTLVIGKGTATVTLGSLSQTYDGTQRPATATTNPAGLTVTFTYNLSATPPTNAGSYSVVGTINDTNYQGSASGTLVIAKAAGTVTLGNLNQTYDGTQQPATATTTPIGMTVNLTYNGSATAPISAGSYTVVGTINNTNYQGSATGTLVIAKAVGTVTLGNLNQTYDGTQQSATATTTPIGLAVTFTYNGGATPPTNAGSYTVVGTINNTNYQGSATSTLVIGKAAGTVTLGSLSQTYDGTPKSATATTTPLGLIVDFTYDGSPTAPTNVGSYTVVGTINNTNYQGSATDTLVIN